MRLVSFYCEKCEHTALGRVPENACEMGSVGNGPMDESRERWVPPWQRKPKRWLFQFDWNKWERNPTSDAQEDTNLARYFEKKRSGKD